MKFADLHVHTVYSDGTSTPAQLVASAVQAGLSCVGVVDHDTVAALDGCLHEANRACIEIIPGIELTSEYEGLEIHMLGYLVDHADAGLIQQLEMLRRYRIERVHKIVEKLQAQSVYLRPEDVFALAPQGTVGRLHIARAMVKEGLVSSIYEAFYKYIGDKCPAYVSGFKLTPRGAIELIRSAGGVAVLAHPYALNRDDLIPGFVRDGLQGLEVYYPEHNPTLTNRYRDLARKYELVSTGGSDFHGSAKPDVEIGMVRIPYELVEIIKTVKSHTRK